MTKTSFILLIMIFSAGCSSAPQKEQAQAPVQAESASSSTVIHCQSSETPTPRDKIAFTLSFYPGQPFPGQMKPEGFNQLKPKEEASSSLDLQRELRPAIFKSIHSSLEALADTPGYMVHLRADEEIEEGHPFPMTMDIRFSRSKRQVFNFFKCCVGSQIVLKDSQWTCV